MLSRVLLFHTILHAIHTPSRLGIYDRMRQLLYLQIIPFQHSPPKTTPLRRMFARLLLAFVLGALLTNKERMACGLSRKARKPLRQSWRNRRRQLKNK